jgi:hypothetical protein
MAGEGDGIALRQATLSESQTRSGHSRKSAHIRGKNPFRTTSKARQPTESRLSAWRGNKFFTTKPRKSRRQYDQHGQKSEI